MSTTIRAYIGGILAAGAIAGGAAMYSWSCPDLIRFSIYLGLTALASLVKLRLPGITGTYSLNSIFLVVGITSFTMPEVVLAACVAVFLQQVIRTTKRPQAVQVLFNMANEAASVAVCAWVLHRLLDTGMPVLPLLALVAALYFVVNTVIVSGVLALLQGKPLGEVCHEWYFWMFPYYLLGVALVGVLSRSGQPAYTESWIIVMPLAYLLHFFSGLSLQRQQDQTGPAEERDPEIPGRARMYIGAVTAAAVGVLVLALFNWQPADPVLFLGYLALALVTSTWKVRLPHMTGTISVNFVMTLFAIATLSLAEALILGAAGAIAQSLWRPARRPRAVQVVFNASCFVLSTTLAFGFSRIFLTSFTGQSVVLLLGLATALLYTLNTVLVAAVLCLVENRPVLGLWRNCYYWSFPFYLVGASAAGLMVAVSRSSGWMPELFVLPLMALVFVSYSLHVKRRGILVAN